MVLSADEGHPKLSPLFDPSVAEAATICDGGGALMLQRTPKTGVPVVDLIYFKTGYDTPLAPDNMISELGGPERIRQRYGSVFAGIPAAQRPLGERQLAHFTSHTGYKGPVIDYRPLIGEFASASAVATVFAATRVQDGMDKEAQPRAALIIGLGNALTAVEVVPS